LKRGGNLVPVNLDEVPDFSGEQAEELIARDNALVLLATIDPRKAKVVEMRFFGGLSLEETAGVLKISTDTVTRAGRNNFFSAMRIPGFGLRYQGEAKRCLARKSLSKSQGPIEPCI
jgi:hypothetical protein